MEQVSLQNSKAAPSLLRQIVDEVDALNDIEKADLLRKLKLQKALVFAQKADTMLEGKFKPMSEEEIVEMVSINRKERYENKTRN